MSLQDDVMSAMKVAMKEKNQTALAALRAVKSEILLAKTASDGGDDLTEEQEIKILS
ncbi:MAG: glutamyl-tRNA amidotransferase, partial [Flavobacteriaceae bacterium]|nr:glutamyl-tRNA amidotransferase [Flavobacteriaceae bacterium]